MDACQCALAGLADAARRPACVDDQRVSHGVSFTDFFTDFLEPVGRICEPVGRICSRSSAKVNSGGAPGTLRQRQKGRGFSPLRPLVVEPANLSRSAVLDGQIPLCAAISNNNMSLGRRFWEEIWSRFCEPWPVLAFCSQQPFSQRPPTR